MINPWKNRIDSLYDDPDELKAAAAKVVETMQSPGWQLLWTFIDQADQDALHRLFEGHRGASGRVMDQAEYARVCGYLAGLREPKIAALAFEQAVQRLEPKPEQ